MSNKSELIEGSRGVYLFDKSSLLSLFMPSVLTKYSNIEKFNSSTVLKLR